MTIQHVQPRFIRHLNAPGYLGMDRIKFDAQVRPYLTEVRLGPQSIAFDRLELDEYQAGGQIGEERRDLIALELLAQFHLAVSVHTVNLEHVLGQIEADGGELHGGRSFRVEFW